MDDRRQLFSADKLNVESGMSAYGSIVYQMKDANMEANSTCEFVYKALKIISKTGEQLSTEGGVCRSVSVG